MARTANDEPLTLEVRKYPNRRYYDTTRSRHLSLQQIHKAIMEGHNIRVVDAKTGEDITSKILTQILLEYEPMKLEVFSSELLTRAIRANDRLLNDFVDLYFRKAFEAFCGSRRRFEGMLRQAHQLTSAFAGTGSWARGLVPPWAALAPGNENQAGGEEGAGVQAEIEELRREVAELKAGLKETRRADASKGRRRGRAGSRAAKGGGQA